MENSQPMPTPVLRSADVVALRRLVTRGGRERIDLLRTAAARPIRSASALREWHDLLLFVLAHPRDETERAWAADAQRAVAVLVESWRARASRSYEGLLNSGIARAPIEGNYSLSLVRWLLRQWPNAVFLTQVDAPLDEVQDVLRVLVLPVEQELLEWGFDDADSLLASLFGSATTTWLPRLLALLDSLPANERVRAHLFARLRLYVRVTGNGADCDLATAMVSARAVGGPDEFHPDGLQREVDLPALMLLPPVRARRLGANATQRLINSARTILAIMGRETDPVTHASAVSCFDMGRGLTIALFALAPSYRLAFDSYVGFMAFRNGAPLAYGGAWIFPGRSKIGINIFPSQRGGESAWFFAQLLRLYHSEFGVDRFEAENYQLGYGNPEGLRSGAYWFYYRLGFRPMTNALRRLAAREANRLAARAGYEVPKAVLNTLVEAGLELVLRESEGPVLDTAALTDAVRQHIVQRYHGDRGLAMSTALRRARAILREAHEPRHAIAGTKPTAAETIALHLWSLPLDLVGDLELWSRSEKRLLVKLLRTKGEPTETRHQRLLRTHRRLLGAWARALQAEK